MYDTSGVASSFQPTLSLTLRGHHHGVRSVAFQPATLSSAVIPKVISGGMDGAVILWDTTGATRAVRCTGHRGPVLSVAQSSRPYLFASGGQDGYVRVWIPSERRFSVTRGAYPEGRGTNSACEWRAHSGATRAVAFARDGTNRLYTIGDDKAVKSWDLTMLSSSHHRAKRMTNKFAGGFSASPLTSYTGSGHTSRVTALAVQSPYTTSQFNHYVASGGDDGVVFVWDTRNRDAAHVIYGSGSGGGVSSLSFHPDGYVLATGNEAGDVNLYDLRRSTSIPSSSYGGVVGASYSLLQHYHAAHMDAVGVGTRSVDFAPNGGWLLSCGEDGSTRLWDVKEGHLYCTVQAHDGPVASCRFSDDGAWFVTGGGVDKTVLVWRSGLVAMSERRALATATSMREMPYTEASSASLSVCSSERPRAAVPYSQQIPVDQTESRLSFTPATPENLNRSGCGPQAESPCRVSTRSISADKPSTPSRRPPIPLAPQSGTKRNGLPLSKQQFVEVNTNLDLSAVSRSTDTRSGSSARERSFERCEQRYNHLITPPSSSNPSKADFSSGAVADVDVASTTNVGANRLASEEREQELQQAQERAHNRERRERILEERVVNLEEAVAALVAHMQRQQMQQEERFNALQATSREQAERNDTGIAELKRAIAALTSHIAPGGVSAEHAVMQEGTKTEGKNTVGSS